MGWLVDVLQQVGWFSAHTVNERVLDDPKTCWEMAFHS